MPKSSWPRAASCTHDAADAAAVMCGQFAGLFWAIGGCANVEQQAVTGLQLLPEVLDSRSPQLRKLQQQYRAVPTARKSAK